MNEIILQETQIEDAPRYSEAVVRRAPVMAKWLWVLFWVLIASNVLSLLCMIQALGKLDPYVQFLAYAAYFLEHVSQVLIILLVFAKNQLLVS